MPTDKRIGVDTTEITSIPDDARLLVVLVDGTDSHISGLNAKAEFPTTQSAPAVTITGDGTATSFDVTHNLGTRSVDWYFENEANSPVKVATWVPTVGDELNSSTVSIPTLGTPAGPIPDGTTVTGYAQPAQNNAGTTLALYAITGYTATVPTGASIAATFADEAAFLAAVPPTDVGFAVRLLSGAEHLLLESRWDGSTYYWQEII